MTQGAEIRRSDTKGRYITMKKAKGLGLLLVVVCAAFLLSGCSRAKEPVSPGGSRREAITFMAPYRDIDNFIDTVHKTYPEVNIEVIPYSGENTTTYLQNMLAADDLPDVCTMTLYNPEMLDVSDRLIDLSGYDFTDNYVESRLRDVTDNGAIYMLPATYNCYGITYNKTLMEKHGWTLPKTFAELEALAEKAKAAGVRLCVSQIQYPGSGFQYFCYIAQTGFLGTLEGIQWQKDYLTGKANISDTPGMMESMRYIQKWKDIGMLDCSGSDASSDHRTREEFIKGNTLFMLGNQNGITESLGTEDEFGLMPYISEDGSQNVFILNVNRYFGVNKKLEKNPEKLEDALKIMRVLSTVEGMSSLHADTTLKSNLLPLKEAKADAAYFKDIAAVIDAGNTATMIYNGWENTLVNTGTKMLEYMQNQATLEDVIRQVDGDQERVVNGDPEIITTATEVISQENCAQAGGQMLCRGDGQRPCAGLAGNMDQRQRHKPEQRLRKRKAVRKGHFAGGYLHDSADGLVRHNQNR